MTLPFVLHSHTGPLKNLYHELQTFKIHSRLEAWGTSSCLFHVVLKSNFALKVKQRKKFVFHMRDFVLHGEHFLDIIFPCDIYLYIYKFPCRIDNRSTIFAGDV